jgi:hypothetical protein
VRASALVTSAIFFVRSDQRTALQLAARLERGQKTGSVMSTESDTRKEIIDAHLKTAGWDVSDRTQVVEEFIVTLVDKLDLRDNSAVYGTREFQRLRPFW